MFHDFDDGDSGFKLLDGEFEVAHGSEFVRFVEVNICQEVEALI